MFVVICRSASEIAAQRQLGKIFICRSSCHSSTTAIRKNEYVCGYLQISFGNSSTTAIRNNVYLQISLKQQHNGNQEKCLFVDHLEVRGHAKFIVPPDRSKSILNVNKASPAQVGVIKISSPAGNFAKKVAAPYCCQQRKLVQLGLPQNCLPCSAHRYLIYTRQCI